MNRVVLILVGIGWCCFTTEMPFFHVKYGLFGCVGDWAYTMPHDRFTLLAEFGMLLHENPLPKQTKSKSIAMLPL